MSRQTKFNLKFPKGGLCIKISLQKAYEEKTGFKQTYVDSKGENRQVRTVKALVKDDNVPKQLDELELVIPWSDVQTSFPYRDEDGRERLLPIDDTVKGKLFTKSDVMAIVGFLDFRTITPRMYDGNHYFLKIQADSKTKSTSKTDRQGYSLLHYILSACDKVIIVKFVSGDREKFAAIYSEEQCMMMSTIVHTTYNREAPEVALEPVLEGKKYAEKLIKTFGLKSLTEVSMDDQYELLIKGYIEDEQARMRGDIKTDPKIRAKIKKHISLADDFFMQIDNM